MFTRLIAQGLRRAATHTSYMPTFSTTPTIKMTHMYSCSYFQVDNQSADENVDPFLEPAHPKPAGVPLKMREGAVIKERGEPVIPSVAIGSR